MRFFRFRTFVSFRQDNPIPHSEKRSVDGWCHCQSGVVCGSTSSPQHASVAHMLVQCFRTMLCMITASALELPPAITTGALTLPRPEIGMLTRNREPLMPQASARQMWRLHPGEGELVLRDSGVQGNASASLSHWANAVAAGASRAMKETPRAMARWSSYKLWHRLWFG